MKNLVEVRKQLAEKGIEFTPAELADLVGELKRLQKRLLRHPDYSDMTVWDKQQLCREAAMRGQEISPKELDDILEIMANIREIDFTR